jgi:hypothetical protein
VCNKIQRCMETGITQTAVAGLHADGCRFH